MVLRKILYQILYYRSTEFADTLDPPPFASYNDENFSVSTVPLPSVPSGSKYLSHWPEGFTKLVYRILKPVDPKVLKSMKMKGPIGYAPNPRTHLRNEVSFDKFNHILLYTIILNLYIF